MLNKKFLIKVVLIFLMAFNFSFVTTAMAEEKENLRITASNPLLGMITAFIGGVEVDVTSLTVFRNGKFVTSGDKTSFHSDEEILFLDEYEAASTDISNVGDHSLHFLYSRVPYERRNINSLFYDPATLPFIAQKIMNVLTSIEPENYFYFQRRLAEFRSRLQSAVELGRNLLEGARILDLTVHTSYLLRSTGCDIQLPEEGFWEKLTAENSRDYYNDVFYDSKKQGRFIVCDAWTPASISKLVEEENLGITLSPPEVSIEYILHLNKHFLHIWDNLREVSP
jgi:hypothetical protein